MTGLWLKPVGRDDIGPLTRLRVGEDQESFVAPNVYSLAQLHYETGAYAFGIMTGDTPVGFAQVIDMREHQYRELYDEENSAFLWRFMIAHSEQGKGHGTAAMERLFDWARGRGLPRFLTSVVETNLQARAFYASLGFLPTGATDGIEIVLGRDLEDL